MSVSIPGLEQRNFFSLEAQRPLPVVWWAGAGILILAFQLYVLGAWVTGPTFRPTPPGPDAISSATGFYYLLLQIGVAGGAVLCMLKWLIIPWRREGRVTSDGRLFIAGAMIFFWDCSMNYSSTDLFYNSNLANMGAWTLGNWPGWMSPSGNLLPEPLFVTIPGYVSLVTTQVIFICWMLRKAKARWPTLGVMSIIGLIILGATLVDSIIEVLLLRTGIYAYPGAIRSISLFAGQTYQFPLNEGFLFGGLGVGAMSALHFFRDDKGQTVAERGVDKLRIGTNAKQCLRLFAVYGFCHLMFFALYTVPMQWFSLHSDPFAKGYPSYMINGMCTYGVHADECPGPGVLTPRLD